MIKKMLVSMLLLGSCLSLSCIKTQARNPFFDTLPDPFQYVEAGRYSHWLLGNYFYIDEGTEYLEIHLPRTEYLESISSFYDTSINYNLTPLFEYWYFDNTYGSISLVTFDDYREDWGTITLTDGVFTSNGIDLTQIERFAIRLVQSYSNIANPEYLDWFNARVDYAFDSEVDHNGGIYDVTYTVAGVLYYQYRFTDIPDRPIDPYREGLAFKGWYLPDGTLYNFDDTIPLETKVEGLVLNARFKIVVPDGSSGMPDTTPDKLDAVLTLIGFNNVVGKLIIYFAISLLTAGLLVAIKLKLFIIFLVESLVLGIFIFLGWLPIHVIIILGLILLAGILLSIFKGR